MILEPRYFKILVSASCVLAFLVVVLGAYTRLTEAGLGCPDWPGCYGHLVLPQQALANHPLETRKAWTEMVHRYAAGSLAILILLIAVLASINFFQRPRFPLLLPLLLLGLVIFQAALGMWTVTLKLLPVVVMGHLLGGLTILALLWWLLLRCLSHGPTGGWVKAPWLFGIFIVYAQIALGGWVSANYAGLSCVGFPSCNGSLIPESHLSEAFNLFSSIGANYQGGLLDSAARATIQMIHRYGALITACYVFIICCITLFKTHDTLLKYTAVITLLVLLCQITLGILNVEMLLPLAVAVAHNAFAALTLLSVMSLAFYTRIAKQRVQQ